MKHLVEDGLVDPKEGQPIVVDGDIIFAVDFEWPSSRSDPGSITLGLLWLEDDVEDIAYTIEHELLHVVLDKIGEPKAADQLDDDNFRFFLEQLRGYAGSWRRFSGVSW